MHDIFFLAVGVMLTGIGLLLITAKVLTYNTLHCADKCNSRKAGKRTYIFPWRKA